MMKLISLAAMAATASAQFCDSSPPAMCRMMCPDMQCGRGQCVMRTGNCCSLSCQAVAGASTSNSAATNDCPDINGDGTVNVNDVLGVLGDFGDASEASDLDNNGDVDVNDVLNTLGAFGDTCTTSAPPMSGGMGGGVHHGGVIGGMVPGGSTSASFNCCGGGTACGFTHCAALGAGQEGCVRPWAMPAGMTAEQCDAGVTAAPAPAPSGHNCPSNKVWNDCASSCSQTCGASMPMMCNMMCNQECACPSNLPVWDASAMMGMGQCVASNSACTMQMLPPGIAIGRPFSVAARPSPTVSELVEGEW